MGARYDADDETFVDGPLVTKADVVGLYPPDVAAVASAATACDPGSGPTRIDD